MSETRLVASLDILTPNVPKIAAPNRSPQIKIDFQQILGRITEIGPERLITVQMQVPQVFIWYWKEIEPQEEQTNASPQIE
jgi:hypothetical protein